MIVRGFEMEKGVDYVDNLSPTPGLAVARLMMSLAIANDMELHKIDIEQAFLQPDELDEDGRYFINPPPESPEAGNKNIGYEVLRPLYGSPSSAGTSSILLLEVPRQATRTSATRSCGRSTVVHRHQELCTNPWTHISNLKGLTQLVSRSPCGYDLQAANTRRTCVSSR
jgi:hypothetical protein